MNAIAALYSKHQGREINPLSEVLVSVGAYGSLYYIMMGLVNPGDEVSRYLKSRNTNILSINMNGILLLSCKCAIWDWSTLILPSLSVTVSDRKHTWWGSHVSSSWA